MPLNKVKLTINSRLYTVVSEESSDYIEMLGAHVNEKVDAVVKAGKNIMGERPIVLAALNICDEYYKLMAENTDIEAEKIGKLNSENQSLKDTISNLRDENKNLKQELEDIEAGQVTIAQTEAIAKSIELQQELTEAENQIKFLQGQITVLKEKNEKMKQECDRRINDILESFDPKNAGKTNTDFGKNKK